MLALLHLFFFLLSIFFIESSKVCFSSVVRHRTDSVFPTSRLFCLSKENDELLYTDVEEVQNNMQRDTYSKSNWENLNEEIEKNPDLLKFGNPSGIRLFKLPAAITDSGFCTGTQNVEINRNLTVRCKPLTTADILSQCTENGFLSALQIFGNGEFVERRENETVEVHRISPEQLRAPIWNGTACIGVVRKANLLFYMNGTQTEETKVQIEYDTLPGNIDYKWFEQTFSVQWLVLNTNEEEETEEESNNKTSIGYTQGGQVYRLQNSVPIPFAVPTLGHCYSGDVPPSPVLFLRPMTSVCTIPTVNCEDARAKAKSFYDQVYPGILVSSPSDDARFAKVERENVTWEQMSLSTSSCRLPVASILHIFYSKQGSTKNYREVIIAGNVQLLLDDIPYLPGQLIRMLIKISFIDVTPPPKSLFAALPYIDIRLPHDFFYPFMSSSAAYPLSASFVVILLIYISMKL